MDVTSKARTQKNKLQVSSQTAGSNSMSENSQQGKLTHFIQKPDFGPFSMLFLPQLRTSSSYQNTPSRSVQHVQMQLYSPIGTTKWPTSRSVPLKNASAGSEVDEQTQYNCIPNAQNINLSAHANQMYISTEHKPLLLRGYNLGESKQPLRLCRLVLLWQMWRRRRKKM